MSKFLAGIAALTLAGPAVMPIQASATEREAGASTAQSTEFSSQYRYRHYGWRHHGWRHRHYGWRGYYGPRRYWGPRYGYYGYPYRYGYYRPGIALGIGPFGFRAF